jgi:UDP-N-acetylmuramate--alanine ligase
MLSPTLAVVTNIDEDHMESYQGLDDLKNAFVQFVNKVPFYGAVILCWDDSNVLSVAPQVKRRVISYGFNDRADLKISDAVSQGLHSQFTLSRRGELLGDFRLNIPGRHNILNAVAAVAVGLDLGLRPEIIRAALESFSGADRRFQHKGQIRGITLVDDYGHHPTEIRASLEAARSLDPRRLVVIFQPHRYSRTRYCFEGFVHSLSRADVLFVSEIYPAGEEPLEGVTSERLVDAIKQLGHKNARYVENPNQIASQLELALEPGDLVITMGAGNIWKVGEELLQKLK